MNDNDQDRSQTEGQEGIDRETELRNRENETGQQQKQPLSSEDRERQFGQQQQQAPGSENRERQFGQQQGQPPSSEDREREFGKQQGGQQSGNEGGGGFVGTGKEDSGDYVTKGEQDPDFAEKGQGAQETSPGQSDIETGQSNDRESSRDE